MRKLLFQISTALIAALFFCTVLSGCEQSQKPPHVNQSLPAPEVSVGLDGTAVWSSVPDAVYYVYVIDNGAEQPTAERRIVLTDGQTIKVKAVSGKDGITDSPFSEPVTYHEGVVAEHDHTDYDDDGKCDICNESVIAELSFYAVNDLHGKFMDAGDQPGVDEFTTYIKDLYADPEREEILLSSGDMWQGTVESSTNKGKLMTEWMNELGFVSMTLGNHEYDWGTAALQPNGELANFPFLAINVTYNGQAVDYCRPSVVVERGGVKIGIIGAIGDCLSSISGDYTDGLAFATGSRLTSLVKDEADKLRAEGCEFIVYSIHDGGSGFSSYGINSVKDSDIEYYDTSLSDGYVDLVFEAHTHKSYILKDEYGVYHLQGGGENSGVSCADVTFNIASGEYSVSPRIISNRIYGDAAIADDPSVDELFDKYFPDSNPYTTVLGRTSAARKSDEICDKVAELYYLKGVETWGEQYDIVYGGGFLRLRSPYNLSAGNLTYANLFSILPFDNDIVLGRVRGSDLQNKFLSDRDDYHYYSKAPSRIDSNAYYYIIVDSYTSTYRYNNVTEVARLGQDVFARDLLADFVSAGGWA